MTEAQARDLFKQILSAIDYLHNQGVCWCIANFINGFKIVHRDLKPENSMCSDWT